MDLTVCIGIIIPPLKIAIFRQILDCGKTPHLESRTTFQIAVLLQTRLDQLARTSPDERPPGPDKIDAPSVRSHAVT